jgi:hypothetical protein
MVASEAQKGGASTAPPVGGQQDDLCVCDLQPTQDQQAAEAGGANVEDDNHRCLYIGTMWDNDIITDNCSAFNAVSIVAAVIAHRGGCRRHDHIDRRGGSCCRDVKMIDHHRL